MTMDQTFMRIALNLGERMLGRVAPNPAVGCVIVKDDNIIGSGVTQPGGRPHAETVALAQAGEDARGATAYITLEPCAHVGKTPPCVNALIAAGITRVVASLQDPDPRVAGRGFAILRAAGIVVDTGVCVQEALAAHEGFFKKVQHGRPLFTLKLATSQDGKIATRTGESQWITGEESRAHSHKLRASHDGVMIGIGTALADDPALTVRLPGLAHMKTVRIVVDRNLRLPLDSTLIKTARDVPLWLVTRDDHSPAHQALYTDAGVTLLQLPLGDDGYADIMLAALGLGARGLTRVLVEGGAHLTTSLIAHDLVDHMAWFTAPLFLGDDARPSIKTLGLGNLAQHPRYAHVSTQRLGHDTLTLLKRK
jgi:diaminohydroxyphosphoribosylaminopyrimidine deaminase/5-amino-6-(5-phosphoribosylamino)uracil reductase